MDMMEALTGAGIRLRNHGTGNHKTLCPQCSHARKHKKDPCLSVTIGPGQTAKGPLDEGEFMAHCHNCDWGTGFTKRENRPDSALPPRREKPAPRKPDFTPGDPDSRIAQWFAGRGISEATLKRNKISLVRVWMPGPDREVDCIAFPYSRDGETVNVKYRSFEKQFRQEKGAEKVLYGLDTIGAHTTVVIVEGEPDALALQEIGLHETMGVLSVPDGAPKEVRDEQPDPEEDAKFSYLWACREYLDPLEKIILATDGDGPGRALAEELARRLGKERCQLVRWPSINDAPRKDANEVLIEDGAEVLRECIEDAAPYPIAGIYTAMDFADKVTDLYQGGRSKGLSTGWAILDEFMTIREGDFTVVTGIPNHGKSEFLDALMVNMARLHGWKFALCSFENLPEEHIAKLAEKHTHAPFWDGPTDRMDVATLKGAIEWVGDYFTFIRADDEAPTIEWILEKAKAAVLRLGVRGLVIDPWNEIEHCRPSSISETEYVSRVLGLVRRFAKVYGCHVWFVAHPMKLQKNKDGKRPAPGPYDISGSAHWANKADFCITVHRPDDHGNLSQIFISKVRHKWLGKKGVVKLRYIPATGEFSDDLQALA